MPNTGIEPAILRSLARRSNQLSYAAAVPLQLAMKYLDQWFLNILYVLPFQQR